MATSTLARRQLLHLSVRPSVSASSLILLRPSSRPIQTTSAPPDHLSRLRLERPISPHFTIYQPQLTWYSSIFNRVTGVALSTALYGFSIGYLGGIWDANTFINLVASFPEWLKVLGKGTVALPFWFHTWNGFRHLGWDLGYFLNLKTSYTAGYTVIGLTAVTTVITALL
ncbi:cytochrome b560 subunit of succinate dehydrogenase [Atractiella rhizophila]|nr:cytochrome b560 subunit of succinate dehydrogenase [Atractiella rhizophila]